MTTSRDNGKGRWSRLTPRLRLRAAMGAVLRGISLARSRTDQAGALVAPLPSRAVDVLVEAAL